MKISNIISNISYSSENYRPGWEEIDKNIWIMRFATAAMKTVMTAIRFKRRSSYRRLVLVSRPRYRAGWTDHCNRRRGVEVVKPPPSIVAWPRPSGEWKPDQ